MVNVNNYGVSNTGFNPAPSQRQNNNNPPVQSNSNQKVNDSYAFNSSSMPAGRVPTEVQVGMWDKASALFKDVLNTPNNLKSYKVFETSIKSNPEGYLQAGSNDAGKIKDLQQKFSYLGMNLTVNGQFGNATEQAVIRFKNSVGINDGFLDKSGKMAVTSVVTPQVWGILNAQVANKLNPNANVSTGSYVTPVTANELTWAKGLMNKVSQYGYKPNASERQQYNNIYQRQHMSGAQTTGASNPTSSVPTAQDIDWAKQMAVKIQQYGYKPNNQEIQRYQDIYKRLQAAKTQPQQSPQTTNGVSGQDMAWATSMMKRVKAGYTPTAQESQKYQTIFNQSQGVSNQNTPQATQATSNNSPVTQDDLAWAQQLETRVTQGYNPTTSEMSKYDNIYKRSQNQPTPTTNQTSQPQQQSTGVSSQELAWAQNMENKVNTQGYKPSSQEMAKYTDIFNRSQGQQSQQVQDAPANTQAIAPAQTTNNTQKPSQKEIDWALELERKTKEENYQPTQNELGVYNDISARLSTANQSSQTSQSTQPQKQGTASANEIAWASQMQTKIQGGYTPTSQETNMLNRIQQKASGQAPQSTPTRQQPVNQQQAPVAQDDNTDTTDTTSVAQPQRPVANNNFTSVSEFAYNDSTINAFKSAFPEVNFKGKAVPYLPDNIAKQTAVKYGFNSVSELQSAIGANVDGRFGPETFFRLSIASKNQGQAPAQNSASDNVTAPATTQAKAGVTQAELDWAVALQSKLSTGYKPNQQEQAQYTDIYSRYQSSGNTIITEQEAAGSVDNSSQATNTGAVDQTQATQQTSSTTPTQQELDWAATLQSKVSTGYKPNQQEQAQYTDIYNRYQSSSGQVAATDNTSMQPSQTTTNTTTQTSLDPNTPQVGVDVNNPSQELKWALELLDKVQQGYVPTDDEVAKYEQAIAKNQSVIANP